MLSVGVPTQHFWRKTLVSTLWYCFRLPEFWHRASHQMSHICNYPNYPHWNQWPQFTHGAQCGYLYTWESRICSTLGHGGEHFWCPNVGWFLFKVYPMANTPRWYPNPLPNCLGSIIEVTTDLQSWSNTASSTTLLAIKPISRTPRTNHRTQKSPHTSHNRAMQ